MNLQQLAKTAEVQINNLVNLNRAKGWDKRILTRISNRNVLTKEQINLIHEFFKPYHNVSVISHTFYTEKTDNFHVNYIPDSLWYGFIDSYYNPKNVALCLDNKCFYSRILKCEKIEINHPTIIAYRSNGFYLSPDFKPLTQEEVKTRCMNSGDSIFIKAATDSCGGFGVKYFDCKKPKEELELILRNAGADIVIQKGIIQHPMMSALCESSVNTVRFLTLTRTDGTVKMYSAIVRMGNAGAKVDNASSGGITCGLDKSGNLKAVGYTSKGERFEHHPTNHFNFSGKYIPNFSKIKDAVCQLAWLIPQCRLLSWDIAIGEDGMPILIEVNMRSGQLDFHQLNNGPVFGEDTEDILDEVFHHPMPHSLRLF